MSTPPPSSRPRGSSPPSHGVTWAALKGTQPPFPPAAPPDVTAGTAPRTPPAPANQAKPSGEIAPPRGSGWALPQTPGPAAPNPPPDEAGSPSGTEPTAEQLVEVLRRQSDSRRDPGEPRRAQEPYKARPISFVPTRWEIVQLWASAHRLQVGLATLALTALLATAYLWRLLALNAEVERQWLVLDQALRSRYAMMPAYVQCIATYGSEDRFALSFADRAMAAWRNAHSEEQVVKVAATMERVMALLARTMRRCEQFNPAPEPDQAASSRRFAALELEKFRSAESTAELVRRYNRTVDRYNARLLQAPGAWIASLAGLHPHRAIFTSGP